MENKKNKQKKIWIMPNLIKIRNGDAKAICWIKMEWPR